MSRPLYRASQATLWVGLKVLFGLRATGRQHVPGRGPVLVVSNHTSFLDPLFLGTMTARQIHFLARASLARSPVASWWLRGVGTVLVDREAPASRPLHVAIELLRSGKVLAVFPEGTRSRTGELGPFKRGILLLLKKTGATVVPAAVRGSFGVLPPGRRFPRLFRRCSVAFGAPMTAEEVLSEGGLDALRQRVAELGGQPLAVGEGETTPASDSQGSDLLRV